MNFQIQVSSSALTPSHSFNALHPMFQLNVSEVSNEVSKRLQSFEHFVVIGIGGSILPLKAFVDALELGDRVHLLDTVDPVVWKKISRLERPLFCVVSKSGETLEIKTLLQKVLNERPNADLLVVTDPEKGTLRSFTRERNLMALEIPPNIGGRFTNFTIFHRALLERFGFDFASAISSGKKRVEELKKDPGVLEKLYQQLFSDPSRDLVLWAYGERLLGLAQWAQQAIAESLGKRRSNGKRVGSLPMVLRGPQDQHSVLQLLIDGPQTRALWFFVPQISASSHKSMGLEDALIILADSTYKTFEERLRDPQTAQPISRWDIKLDLNELTEAIVTIQAFVEYAGQSLEINAFDQPGVERGKQIARELIAERFAD